MSGNETFVVKLTYKHHTTHAVLVEDESWLPLSVIETRVPLIDLEEGEEFECEVPQWLLEREDLEHLVE